MPYLAVCATFLIALFPPALPPPSPLPLPPNWPNYIHHQGMLTHQQCTDLQIACADNAQPIDLYHKLYSRAPVSQSLSRFCCSGLRGTVFTPAAKAWLVNKGT